MLFMALDSRLLGICVTESLSSNDFFLFAPSFSFLKYFICVTFNPGTFGCKINQVRTEQFFFFF